MALTTGCNDTQSFFALDEVPSTILYTASQDACESIEAAWDPTTAFALDDQTWIALDRASRHVVRYDATSRIALFDMSPYDASLHDERTSWSSNWGTDLIHIDGIKGNWEGTVFFRDPDRKKQMGLEHSVYTTGEYLAAAMEKLESQGYDLNQSTHPSAFTFSERLSENAAVGGEAANKITLTFSERHKPWFEYDAESGKYLRFEYGEAQMDGWLNTQIATENVLVLRMKTVDVKSDLHLVDVTTTGSGDGYYFCGGKYVPITWKKDSYNSEIRYFDAQGNDLVVARGKTFASVVTESASVVTE